MVLCHDFGFYGLWAYGVEYEDTVMTSEKMILKLIKKKKCDVEKIVK